MEDNSGKDNDTHAIIKAAEEALMGESSSTSQDLVTIESHPNFSPDYNPLQVYSPPDATPPSVNQKFGDMPTQIREQTEINIYDIKKLNLAATIEALERATQSYEAFPTADSGFAVASLSEQVQKLTKDLEKSQDPKKLYDAILMNILQPFAEQVVHAVASEIKWLKAETKAMIPPDKAVAFQDTLNKATTRIGPGLKDSLELSKIRLLKVLSIKEKPPV